MKLLEEHRVQIVKLSSSRLVKQTELALILIITRPTHPGKVEIQLEIDH